jgi:aminoglycoside phosphotransferase (APT) family kinase protein
MALTAVLPGHQAVQAWLRACPGFEGASVASIAPADGGVSNITCCVELAGAPFAAVALRLQRERGIFEPYDVIREGEVIRALNASPLPVPRFVAAEPDRSALGAPFIVMEWIDAPHMGVAGPEGDFGAFTRAVASVHATDWRRLGLGAILGVPSSPADAIRGEIDAVAARMPAFACESEPLLVRALGILRPAIPADGRMALCQGDINVFNYLFLRGQVVGIVDWEQARISDPRSDIGQLVALSHLKGAPWGPAEQLPFSQMYAAAAQQPLSDLAYFRALWLFELGVIYHGWRAFNESEPWYSWSQIDEMLSAALLEIA